MPPLRPSGVALDGPARLLALRKRCPRSWTTAGRSAAPLSTAAQHGPIFSQRRRAGRPVRPCLPGLRRAYHSSDHPPPPGEFNAAESAILAAAYARVPEHGFSRQALALGARDAGYLDVSANLLHDEAFSLVRWHLATQRRALADRALALYGAGRPAAGVAEKVERLTWERLQGNRAVIARWQEVGPDPPSAARHGGRPPFPPPENPTAQRAAADTPLLPCRPSPSWRSRATCPRR